MTITVEIPEQLAHRLIDNGQEPARAALEALALEGYRSDRLSENDIRELLGFDTRIEVHSFLKEHGAFMPYDVGDLEHDRKVASQVARRAQAENRRDPSDRRSPG
jgi:hypothetical protein